MDKRSHILIAMATSSMVGTLWRHDFEWWTLLAFVVLAAFTRSMAFVVVATLAISSSWAAVQHQASYVELSGTRDGCFRVMQWPRFTNYGSTETIVKVGSYRMRIADQHLASKRLGLFDRVCVEGVVNELNSFESAYLRDAHVVAELKVTSISHVRRASFPSSLPTDIRTIWFRGIENMSPQRAALFKGIVLGDTNDQSRSDKDVFRRSGLIHIMAVSGQNLAFIAVVAFGIFGAPRSMVQALALLGVLGGFTLITGMQASVLRAAVMSSLAITAQAFGFKAKPVELLCSALLVLLALDPLLMRRLSFQLSVGATAGIVLLAPLIQSRIAKRTFGNPFSIAISAQIGTVLPLAIGLRRFVPVSSLIYVLLEPVVAALMIIGVSFGLFAGLVAPISTVYCALCSVGIDLVLFAARMGSALPTHWQYLGWIGPILMIAVPSSKRSGSQTKLSR